MSPRRARPHPDQLGLFGGTVPSPDAARADTTADGSPADATAGTRAADAPWPTGRAPAVPFALWAGTAWIIRETTRRTAKVAALAALLRDVPPAALAPVARWFAGRVFASHDARTLQVGRTAAWAALGDVSGWSHERLADRRLALGDSGDLAAEALAGRTGAGLTVGDVAAAWDALAAAGTADARIALLRRLYAAASAEEARWLLKIPGGALRIGLLEAQVEEAIADAFEAPLDDVRRAAMLRGDVGEVAVRAAAGTLHEATLALFHPLGFMLAQPGASAEAIAATMPAPFVVEPKYDGIRAQAHVDGPRVRLFSRTLDDVTDVFPEAAAALAFLGEGLVLDGELLAVRDGDIAQPLPFRALQGRLGRRHPDAALMRAVPVAFVAYDLLAAGGALCVDEPWHVRRGRLDGLPWQERAHAAPAPVTEARDAADVRAAFDAARQAGHEGLVAKDPSTSYAPGRRGAAWQKLKQAQATLDVVVLAAERGSGKRAKWLSDVTFAVRDDAPDAGPAAWRVIGKAYTGLTDDELAALTTRLEALTEERRGGLHRVSPAVVLEVTFDLVQPSTRHDSGYALRFPRIVRVRDDKAPHDADTLARVRALAAEASASP